MARRRSRFEGIIPGMNSNPQRNDHADSEALETLRWMTLDECETRQKASAAMFANLRTPTAGPTFVAADSFNRSLPCSRVEYNRDTATERYDPTVSHFYLPCGLITPPNECVTPHYIDQMSVTQGWDCTGEEVSFAGEEATGTWFNPFSRASGPETPSSISTDLKGKGPARHYDATNEWEHVPQKLEPERQPNNPPTSPHKDNFERFRFRSDSSDGNRQAIIPLAVSNTGSAHDSESPFRGRQHLGSSHVGTQMLYQPASQEFKPSQMKLDHLNGSSRTNEGTNGSKYRGNRKKDSSITGLADHLNCSVWLYNIRPSSSMQSIFNELHFGTIVALSILPPNKSHPMCGANLTFADPESAASLIAKSKSPGIILDGERLYAIYNRRGIMRSNARYTRVILVEGPEELMNYDFWNTFFNEACQFRWDRIIEHHDCPIYGRSRMEFRFMRATGQANMCLAQIKRDLSARGDIYAGYGPDPCSTDSQFSHEPFSGAIDMIHNMWT